MKTYAVSDKTLSVVGLVEEVRRGDEIILTENDEPIAKLVALPLPPSQPPEPRKESVKSKDFYAKTEDFGVNLE